MFTKDYNASYMDTMLEAAKVNKGKLLFSYSNGSDKYSRDLANAMDIGPDDFPILIGVSPGGKVKDHRCQVKPQDLTVEDVTKFITMIAEESYDPIQKSQPIPEENDEPLKVIVGKNYKDVVEDESKHVFVLNYAPWDMFSKKYLKLFKELAEQVQHPDLIIGKYDGTQNQIAQMDNMGYPSLNLFTKDNKKPGILYKGGRDLDELKAFLFKNLPDL